MICIHLFFYFLCFSKTLSPLPLSKQISKDVNMRTLIIPLLLFTLLASLSHATNVHYCDKNVDYEVKVYAIEVTPNPISKGHPATLSISASTGKVISGGKVKIDVAYYGWHVYSENHDLCTETPCPVPTGDFVIAHSEVLPAFIIPGTYYVKMNIMDANNKQMSCVGFDITIGFGASVAAN